MNFSALPSDLTELFPWGILERALEKLCLVLHDKVIWKAVLMDKGQKKPAKKLQSACISQPARCLDSQSSKTSSVKGSFSVGSKTSSSSSKLGEGKKF